MAFQNTRPSIAREDFEYAQEVIRKLSDYYSSKVVGQNTLRISMTAAIIADGHILIESVPGLAKTTAAKAVSDAVDGKFSRVQCTPDLLPSDIIGTQIYHQETGKFETIFGPVFANFVLLDEVNRSSAKTQSAMLEAMQERQVTIGGITYKMPQDIFIVIATQNPIEQEGTYPLSEAQTDRFMIQDIAEMVYADRSVKQYISAIVNATRFPKGLLDDRMAEYIRIGASPRASIAFLRIAKAVALMRGRTYVTPDDVKEMSHQVLRHRIGLNYSAFADGVETEQIIDAIVSKIKLP